MRNKLNELIRFAQIVVIIIIINFSIDELEVTASEAKLSSHTIWGLVRALESFSQLIYSFPDNRVIKNPFF